MRARACYGVLMTKILEKAIAKARTLPAEDQDVLGAVMLAFAGEELARIGELDDGDKSCGPRGPRTG